MKEHDCCICGQHFAGWGANPEPFGKGEDRCCDFCDRRFVIPMRLKRGRAVDPELLRFVADLAKMGRFLEETNQMISAQKKKKSEAA